MAKLLKSVFTDDMNTCIYTGSKAVERHHIFGGASRKLSEQYGYVVPLRPDYHPNGVHADPSLAWVDLELKQMAQRDFEEKHGTREEFVHLFGRSYL